MIALLAISIGNLYVASFTGDIIGGFYATMEAKDAAAFNTLLWKAVLILSASAILDSMIKFIAMMLAWHWRRRLTYQLQTQYLSNRTFYKMLNFDNRVDNPYVVSYVLFWSAT
jgi:ATP-binding cassette subfamily D (ALD) protein 4